MNISRETLWFISFFQVQIKRNTNLKKKSHPVFQYLCSARETLQSLVLSVDNVLQKCSSVIFSCDKTLLRYLAKNMTSTSNVYNFFLPQYIKTIAKN